MLGGGDSKLNKNSFEYYEKLKIPKCYIFLLKKRRNQLKTSKFIVKKQKSVPTIGILIFCGATLQLVQNIKPIRIFFCTTGSCSDLGIYLIYNIYKFHQI